VKVAFLIVTFRRIRKKIIPAAQDICAFNVYQSEDQNELVRKGFGVNNTYIQLCETSKRQ